MVNQKSKFIKQFNRNIWSFWIGVLFFGTCLIVYIYELRNPNTTKDEFEIYFGIIGSSILCFIGLITLAARGLRRVFPNLFYIRINLDGVIYKNLLFPEKIIPWNKIEHFYIQNLSAGTKFVRIKFKIDYSANFFEKQLIIPGNPEKVLKIMEDSLRKYSKKNFL